MLNVVFDRDVEPIGQTNLNLLGKMMIGRAEMDYVVFVNQTGVNSAGRKDVSIR